MKTWLNRIIRSKTMWLSAITAALGVIQVNWGVFTPYMTPTTAGHAAVALGIVIAVLRVVTTQSLKDK